jgi:hypothetical protein
VFHSTTNSPVPEGYKRCSKGDKCVHPDGPVLPATNEYFYRRSNWPSGLNSSCKRCDQYHKHEYYAKHIDEIKARRKELYPRHAEKDKERVRLWEVQNKERAKATRKAYRAKHAAALKAKKHEYHKQNSPKIAQKVADWRKKNPERRLLESRISCIRRRARKRNLPDTMTDNDWLAALEYFQGCCAVCGKLLTNTRLTHADHWIPICSPDCPGTVATNIVPLCGGRGGCNPSKNSRPPLEWLIDRFGAIDGLQIEAKIQAYFDWVRANDK